MLHDTSSTVESVAAPTRLASLIVDWHGEQLELFAERAMYWRAAGSLLIADAHFGKAAAFRAAGVPVPTGTTQANLDRLSSLLDQTSATRFIVLGDFLHARDGRAEATFAAIAQWRERRCDLQILLVRGNHDHNAGDPPAAWKIDCVDEPHMEGPFAFRHTPPPDSEIANPRPVIAGHVHPCAVLRDRDGSAVRVPCFHVSSNQLIMPAFGAFTGMHPIKPVRGDRVFAAANGVIVQSPHACES